MSWKPYYWRGYNDRYLNSGKDFGANEGKKKQPYMAGNYGAMEEFHYLNFGPYPMLGPVEAYEVPSFNIPEFDKFDFPDPEYEPPDYFPDEPDDWPFPPDPEPKVNTTHRLELVPLTGDSFVSCQADPDGRRAFQVIYHLHVNGSYRILAPDEFLLETFGSTGKYEYKDGVVTVDEDEPGNDSWTFKATDYEYGGETSDTITIGPAGYKYWRLYVNAVVDGKAKAYIAEMQLMDSGGNDLVDSIGGTASASSEWFGLVAGKAFDNTLDSTLISRWNSNDTPTPHWLKMEFNSPVNIIKYSLQGRTPSGSTFAPPSGWYLQRSKNNSQWETVHAISGETDWFDSGQPYNIAYKEYTI